MTLELSNFGDLPERVPPNAVEGKEQRHERVVYIRLDLALAGTAICVLNEKGEILREETVDSEPEALVRFFNWIRVPE